MQITQDYLRENFSYEPDTGLLIRLRADHKNRGLVGKPAGSPCGHGHLLVSVLGKRYAVHRIIWLYVTGEWPDKLIDHANGVPDDNRWCNLRLATHTENTRNTVISRRNTTGYKGVSFDPTRGKFSAHIKYDGRLRCLGRFLNPAEAYAAYCNAATTHFGEFARLA